MAKVSLPSAASLKLPASPKLAALPKVAMRPLSSPGGIVQKGGYLGPQSIDKLAYPRFTPMPEPGLVTPRKPIK